LSYIIDTNIISEMVKAQPNPRVIDFLQNTQFLLPSFIFAELAYGADKLNPNSKQRLRYIQFIETLKHKYHRLIIPLSVEMAEMAGRLRAREEKTGRILSFADAIIAATSIQTTSTLVTRNTKDFSNLDIPLLNPFVQA